MTSIACWTFSKVNFYWWMKQGAIAFMVLLLMSQAVTAQQSDSLAQIHSPRKATIMSAVLPGAGQAYNRKYWKIPVVYAGFGVLGYLVKFNNDEYKVYKEAYKLRLDGDETTVDAFTQVYADQDLATLKDYYRRNRDLSIIGMSLLYILNIIDASVDAHLFYFNVNDDLTMQWQPSIQFNHRPAATMGLVMKF